MSIIKDTFFGGAEKKAAQATERGLERSIEAMRVGADRARGEIMDLYPAAEESMRQGSQGALDVMGQFLPQQANVFQQGNMNAQGQLAAGLPQIQNALMGGAVDYSQFQPQQINFDRGVFNQQLPQMQTSQQALNPEPATPQGGAMGPFQGFNANSFLGGGFGSGGPFNGSTFGQNMRIRQ